MINPQLASLIESLWVIVRTLRDAQPFWWRSGLPSCQNVTEEKEAETEIETEMESSLKLNVSDDHVEQGKDFEDDEEEVVDIMHMQDNVNYNISNPKPGPLKMNQDEDSDATTLGDEHEHEHENENESKNVNDNDSLSSIDTNTPILKRKRRKRGTGSSSDFIAKLRRTSSSNENTNSDSKPTASVPAPEFVHVQQKCAPSKFLSKTMLTNESSADEESIATQVYSNINSQNTCTYGGNRNNGNGSGNGNGNSNGYVACLDDSPENHGFLSGNQTPQDIHSINSRSSVEKNMNMDMNISCAIPEESFRLSPIAMAAENSQESRRRNIEVGFLKNISEEVEMELDMSGMGGTTEEVMDVSPMLQPKSGPRNNSRDEDACKIQIEEVHPNSKKKGEISDGKDNGVEEIVTSATTTITTTTKAINTPLREQKASSRNRLSSSTKLDLNLNLNASKPKPTILTSQQITTAVEAEKQDAVATSISLKSGPDLVSVERQPPIPRVFLISPSQSLVTSDQRTLRKLTKNDRFAILRPGSQRDSKYADLDFNFNFDSEEDAKSYMRALFAMDSTSHYPVEYSYAICSNAEYQTFEGYIMPRNFRYILAVASGLSIIDFSYLRKATSASFGIHDSRKYLYAPGTMKVEDISSGGGGVGAGARNVNRRKRSRARGTEEKEETYKIAGDVESMELMGPLRSREAMIKRLKSSENVCEFELSDNTMKVERTNNGLLEDFEVLLHGEFDAEPASTGPADNDSRKSQKRKGGSRPKGDKSKNIVQDASDDVYSKGRVSLLLRLCGATVIDLTSYKNLSTGTCTNSNSSKKVVILTRCKADKKTQKQFCSILKSNGVPIGKSKEISSVCCKWLLDSIAEFKVKPIDNDS